MGIEKDGVEHFAGASTEATLTLYSTLGCHLCELAEDILYAESLRFEIVDIAEDVNLIERYGVRIPVVVDSRKRELGWPFDQTMLRAWLAE